MMQDVYQIMGIHKTNTTAYHPQTDGLVERFNRTLTDMVAKKVEKNGRNWDQHLSYVLYAYRASRQEYTQELPFFLLYRCDRQLPFPASLTQPRTHYQVDIEDYRTELTTGLTEAWELARSHVKKAQKRQKKTNDRRAKPSKCAVGTGCLCPKTPRAPPTSLLGLSLALSVSWK